MFAKNHGYKEPQGLALLASSEMERFLQHVFDLFDADTGGKSAKLQNMYDIIEDKCSSAVSPPTTSTTPTTTTTTTPTTTPTTTTTITTAPTTTTATPTTTTTAPTTSTPTTTTPATTTATPTTTTTAPTTTTSTTPATTTQTTPTSTTTTTTTAAAATEFSPTSSSSDSSNSSDSSISSNASKKVAGVVEDVYKVGRLGPTIVKPNKRTAYGPIKFAEDDLELESHTSFGSIRANVCVFRGKWMYEVTLCTGGVQQLGWALLSCPFTQEAGVGDAADSYAYDGKRVKKWNQAPQPYGQPWVAGDVIGCCIDLDVGDISFYRNGQAMGVAFRNIRINTPGVAYFPALSLSFDERSLLNFGSRPFRFPVDGFLPLQAPPSAREIFATRYYVECLGRLLARWDLSVKSHISSPTQTISWEDGIIVAGIIFDHLGPHLLSQYHIAKVWYPFLVQLLNMKKTYSTSANGDVSVTNSRSEGSSYSSGDGCGVGHVVASYPLLNKLVELMRLCLEQHEFEGSLRLLLNYIGYSSMTRDYKDVVGKNSPQEQNNHKHTSNDPLRFPPLILATSLLRLRIILDLVLHLDIFPKFLENLFFLKQPNKADLAALIPNPWWLENLDNAESADEDAFEKDKQILRDAITEHEDLMYDLVVDVFISDKAPTSIHPYISPCDHFLAWLQQLMRRNEEFNITVRPPGLSDASVLSSLYAVLLRMVPPYFKDTDADQFPTELFYDPQVDFFDRFGRLGGTMSHLRKHLPIEETTSDDVASSKKQPALPLMVVLLHTMVLLYHIAMANKFKNAAVERQHQQQLLAQLTETQTSVARAQASSGSVPEHILTALKVYRADVSDAIRMYAWHNCTLSSPLKQTLMQQSVKFLVKLLQKLSEKGKIFSYIPEFYLETVIDTFHADPTFNHTKTMPESVAEYISFLVLHFSDKRIINPDVKDLLLKSMSELLQYADYVEVFEKTEAARTVLMPKLLESFDNKFWVPICKLLLRFWRDRLFAHSLSMTSYAGASPFFRTEFRTTLDRRPDLADAFINKVLNNLNWAVSEFSAGLNEIKDMIDKPSAANATLPQAQRKANIMFDIAVSLLRLIEVVSLEAPDKFLESDVNATRVVELLLIVISRTTTGPDSATFDAIVKHEPSLVDRVSRVSVFAPLLGILVNLADRENLSQSDVNNNPSKQQLSLGDEVSIVRRIVDAPAFNLTTFEYLEQYDWTAVLKNDPTLPRVKNFAALVTLLRKEAETKKEIVRSPSIELCSICYAEPIDTKFEPCGHHSCYRCISRHLMNNTRCFFCNAEVKSTVKEFPHMETE